MINIAVLGYGTVGSGVVEVIDTNKELISKNVGEEVNVKYVLDLRDFPGNPIQERITHDYDDIIADSSVKVVVEVMGGVHPAYDFTRAALESGKSVCTSNKELVEKYGTELISIAKDMNVNYLFEASVGGGIPVIRTLTSCLTADRIDEISGIINGTTNYMLSKMYFEGVDYDSVLKEAQANGYAEAHPEADVEGYDACRKIAILSSIISGHEVNFEDIYCEGITKISPEDIAYAKKLGLQIKLIAQSKREDGSLAAMVAPFLVPPSHPLHTVNGVFNAVFVKGNMLGDSMYYGSGAGKLPTASAVCADIVEACKNLDKTLYTNWDNETLKLIPTEDVKRRFLIRMSGDKEDFIERVTEEFGEVEWIDKVVDGEFAFITKLIPESEFNLKIKDFPIFIHMLRMVD